MWNIRGVFHAFAYELITSYTCMCSHLMFDLEYVYFFCYNHDTALSRE